MSIFSKFFGGNKEEAQLQEYVATVKSSSGQSAQKQDPWQFLKDLVDDLQKLPKEQIDQIHKAGQGMLGSKFTGVVGGGAASGRSAKVNTTKEQKVR